MAKPSFQIWKNKPSLDSRGQYVQVDVEDYYAIGFDNDAPEDDIYSNYTDVGRGKDSDINQPNYFQDTAINLGDHNYGVGEFRIEKLRVKTEGDNHNHNGTDLRWYFVDSALFQCPTDIEPGCIGPDNRNPNQDVNPLTGEYITTGDTLINRFVEASDSYAGTDNSENRLYRVGATSNFDCKWGGDDEMDFESSFEVVGTKVKDQNEDAALNYYPNDGNGGGGGTGDFPPADSGLWRWKFFPHVNHDNVKSSEYYGFENEYFPPYYSDDAEFTKTFVNTEVFANTVNIPMMGGSNDYTNDYDDGAFYIVFYGRSGYCGNWSESTYSTPPTVGIYTIPKKHIYDHWNGYRPICFRWGTSYDCESGDIKFNFSIPSNVKKSGSYDYQNYFKANSALVRVIPPRVFYEEDSTADVFRPVNNEDPVKHLKNPMDKDPVNIYFTQLENCIYAGERLGDDFECPYPSFYPYVIESLPFLYTPLNDIQYSGNLIGITNGLGDPYNVNDPETMNPFGDITLNTEYIRNRDFNSIAYGWIGETNLDEASNLTVQRRYESRSVEEAQTSAPNFVNFWISPTTQTIENGPVDEFLLDMSDEMWVDDISQVTGFGYKWCIARWGDEEDATDEDINSIILDELDFWTRSPSSYYQEVTQTGRYDWVNVKDDSGLGILSHQYQAEGPKEIKALVFSYIKNEDQINTFERIFQRSDQTPFQTIHWKLITIRININLSEVLVEDFSEIGGSDFTYIPMNVVSPVIGGMHKNSDYQKSIDKIYSANLFHSTEVLERIRTRKALENDHMGYWPGKMDLEQIRLFNRPFDISYLLGIGNKMAVTSNRFRPHDYKFYWDGIENSFSNETSVGEIFISDNVDVNLKSSCVLELNTATLFGNKILDSSGSGNIGILIGDYKLRKDDILEPIVREKSMKTPETSSEDGAI